MTVTLGPCFNLIDVRSVVIGLEIRKLSRMKNVKFRSHKNYNKFS